MWFVLHYFSLFNLSRANSLLGSSPSSHSFWCIVLYLDVDIHQSVTWQAQQTANRANNTMVLSNLCIQPVACGSRRHEQLVNKTHIFSDNFWNQYPFMIIGIGKTHLRGYLPISCEHVRIQSPQFHLSNCSILYDDGLSAEKMNRLVFSYIKIRYW